LIRDSEARHLERQNKEHVMDVRPLHDRIVVQRIEEGEQKVGGIIIPDTVKEKPQQGTVIAVGNGKSKDRPPRSGGRDSGPTVFTRIRDLRPPRGEEGCNVGRRSELHGRNVVPCQNRDR
jgi:hypothetical protein